MKALLHALAEAKLTVLTLGALTVVAVSILVVPHQVAQHQINARRTATTTRLPATPTVPDDALVWPVAPGSWQPSFVESFNGRTLDSSRWNTCFWWAANSPLGCDGSSLNGELERYLPQNVTVHDGALDIITRHDIVVTDSRSYNYTSGLITTEGKFSFLYGYVEARVRVPQGKGIWPAVWLLPADRTSTNEVDVAEILCDRPTVFNSAVHWEVNGAFKSEGGVYVGSNLSTGYHVVAIDWEPTSMTWYEDGVVVYRVADPARIPHKSMYLILNSAVGGYWSGNPDASTPFPGHFAVDWVQVWKNSAVSHA